MQESVSDISHNNISLSNEYHRIEDRQRRLLAGRHLPSFGSESLPPSRKSKPQQQSSPTLTEQTSTLISLMSENSQLQSYIKELVDYVNDSNNKYSENIQKYGIAYKELYVRYANLEESSGQEILLLRNEAQAERDVLLMRTHEVQEARKTILALKEEVEEERNRGRALKEEVETQWQEHQNNKAMWNQVLLGVEDEGKHQKQQIFDSKNEVRRLEADAAHSENQINKLNAELQKREALPERIQRFQKDLAVKEATLQSHKDKLQQLHLQNDTLKLQLSRSQKQRQQLKIKNTELSGDFESYFRSQSQTLQQTWKDKEFTFTLNIARLNEQMEQLKLSLNSEIEHSNHLLEQAQLKEREVNQLSKQVRNEITEKDSYISEFRGLKSNYQQVIDSLETTVDEVQHKLWTVSDRNKELEFEVDKFRELAAQLESVNNERVEKGATDMIREEVELRGLGDPVRLLRGETEKREAEKFETGKYSFFKEVREEEVEADPWSNLMDKISSM